jgi:hypothetical protein
VKTESPLVKADPITYILRKIFDFIKPDIVYLFSEPFSEIFDRVVSNEEYESGEIRNQFLGSKR